METNLIIENLMKGLPGPSPDQEQPAAVQDRIAALELQLKIYRQAEVIGEIGNWQINLNTFETWYSENTFRIYGIEPGSLKSYPDTFSSFIIDEEREFVLNLLEKSYLERIPLHLEFRIRRADGQERHIYIVSSVTKNAKGEPLLTGITQDITERKQLEVQLKTYTEKMTLQNESFMHAEQIGLFGTWEINLQTRQTRYSDNFFRIFGLKPSVLYPGLDEFIGFIHPDDQSIYKDALKKIFSGDVPIEAEMRIMRNEDKPRHIRIRCKLLKNVEGDPIVLGLLKDITTATRLELQLKEMNELLQIQNETFRQAEKTINIGSWTWNLDTNILTASDQVYLILGLKPQSIPATFETFDKYIHPLDKPIIERLNREMSGEPAERDYEYRIVRADGKIRHLRARCHPMVSSRGHQVIVGTIQDISDDMVRNHHLKERIHFAEMLSENIVDKICITNTSNIVVAWNGKSEKAFGLNKEEVLGRNIFEIFPRIKKPETIDRYNRVLNGESIYLPNLQLEYLEGSYEVTMLPIKEEGEDVTAVLTILHDITEHEKLKSELQERLEFIERLIESSVNRIMVLNRNLDFVYWNKKAEDHYHSLKENVVGNNLAEIFPGYRKLEPFARMKEAWQGKIVHIPANRAVNALEYYETYYVPIKNHSQQVIALLWIEHDLTELIHAEKDFKQSKDLLESVFDTSMTGIAVFESIRNKAGEIIDFRIKLMNEYGSQLLNADFTGEKQLDVFPEKTDGGFFKMNKAVVETGIPADTERFYSWPNVAGWFHITAAKLGDGLVIGFDDISSRKQSEAQLIKQRSILLHAEEIAKLGSWELNTETNIFMWSDQVFRIYDYSPQAFLPTLDFYLHTSQAEDRESIEMAFASAKLGEKFSIIHRLHTLDGRQLYVLLNGQPVTDESGKVNNIVGTIQDITDRKVIEEELRAKNDNIRLRHHVERQVEKVRQTGSWQLNLDTKELVWGETMFEMFGFEPYSFNPTFASFLELIHPNDRERIKKEFDEAERWDDKERKIFEFKLLIRGKVHYMKASARRISNRMGSFVVGSTMDFTEDTLLHQQLAERVEFAEALIEFSIDRIIALDSELKISAWNKSCEKAFGYTREQVYGRSFFDVFPRAKENESILAALNSALEGTPVYIPVQQALLGNGYTESHYIPLRNGEDQVYGVLNIRHDVTEKIENEREMQELNESLSEKNRELREMNDELNSFAFIASHDLREPLRKVQVFSDRLMKKEADNLSDRGKEELMRIRAAVKRMDELIDDILNFSSVNASDKAFVNFDLNQLLREVQMDMSESINEKQAVLEYSDLPSIEGNPSHFSHLFRNLISNSLKYQPKGQQPHIRILSKEVKGSEIQHHQALRESVYLMISVIDNGIGFEQQFEHRIFQMFQRLHGMHEYPGTGMGLSICKKIVDIYQGFITVESAPQQGATFNCFFKLRTDTTSDRF